MSAAGFMPDEAAIAGIRLDIEAYEAQRKAAARSVRWRVPLYLCLLLAIVFGLATVLNLGADPYEQWFSTLHVYLYLAGFLLSFAVYVLASSAGGSLQASLRDKLLPTAFGFIEDVRLQKAVSPESFARLPRESVGDYNGSLFDDVISGSYDGFSFELYEAALWRRSGKVDAELFDGIIVAFDMVKPFDGILIATVRTNAVMSFFSEIFGSGLKEIRSGVQELDMAYEFRTSNVDAAQPLVSGQMAQALTWLKEAWPGEPARLALKGKDGFLLLPHKKNFFELPASNVPLDYKTHIEPIIADMATMLAITALVRKIGT